MFIHNPLPVQELTSIEKDGKRFYLVEGEEYPSVTTVLSSYKSKSIAEWRERVGASTAEKITRQATTRGTAVHQLCEDYVNNKENYTSKAMPANVSLFKQIKDFLDDKLQSVYNLEIPLHSKVLKAAGRCDMLGRIDDKICIVDYKTSSKIKKEEWIEGYFLQTTAYSMMVEEMYDLKIDRIVVVIAVEEENAPQIFIKSPDEYRSETINLFKLYHTNGTQKESRI